MENTPETKLQKEKRLSRCIGHVGIENHKELLRNA